MKLCHMLLLGAVLAVPQWMLAELPFTNEAFGKIEGTLDFCAQVDPQAAPKYQEQKRQIVRDVPERELAEARDTQEYKDAYEWITAELSKVEKDKAAKTCAASLEGK